MELTRRSEALIRSLHTRHGRRKAGFCLCEGVRATGELMATRPDLIQLVVATDVAARELNWMGEICVVSERKMAELSATVNSQGVLAVAKIPAADLERRPEDPFLFALDGLNDPGNFGTVCRTVRAVGLKELWYTRGSVDPFGDKAIRAAMGAQFALVLRCYDDLQALRRAAAGFGFERMFLTDPHQGESCFRQPALYDRSVVVIGGEANGVTALRDAEPVTIPMPGGYESLNAAQAATVFLFEYVRRTT